MIKLSLQQKKALPYLQWFFDPPASSFRSGRTFLLAYIIIDFAYRTKDKIRLDDISLSLFMKLSPSHSKELKRNIDIILEERGDRTRFIFNNTENTIQYK